MTECRALIKSNLQPPYMTNEGEKQNHSWRLSWRHLWEDIKEVWFFSLERHFHFKRRKIIGVVWVAKYDLLVLSLHFNWLRDSLLQPSILEQGSISYTYLRKAFMPVAPQSVRTQSSCQYLFMLIGSTSVKPVPRTLIKLSLDAFIVKKRKKI